mgnify:CR=1 FL=1
MLIIFILKIITNVMNRKSRYNIIIDFDKSFNSYIYDKNSRKSYLDFFGQYATLAIGYNNDIFKNTSFLKEMKSVSKQKIVNNEILSTEGKSFDKIFSDYVSNKKFDYFHYACTGALAVEAAIKTAMDYKKGCRDVISFKGSFHGINGYGGMITHRFDPVSKRLNGFPRSNWTQLENPIYEYKNNKRFINYEKFEKCIKKLELKLSNNKACCVLIEPIQCTFGDQYFPKIFLKKVRELCNKYKTPLIFDEIQTGFCATGKKWFYEHTEIIPDIVIFGKKTQLSGIMVNKKFSNIFQNPLRLEVTWDADIVDMVRCKYIIKAYKKYNVLKKVNENSDLFYKNLFQISGLFNIRRSGLLFAFDLENNTKRNNFVNKLTKNGLLCNPTRDKTVRFRPSLFVNKKEINTASNIISDSM